MGRFFEDFALQLDDVKYWKIASRLIGPRKVSQWVPGASQGISWRLVLNFAWVLAPDMDQNEVIFGTSDFVFFYKSTKRNHDLATDGVRFGMNFLVFLGMLSGTLQNRFFLPPGSLQGAKK